MQRPNIAITMGDAAGIGGEVTVKALMRQEIYERCVPVVFGDYAALQSAAELTRAPVKLNVVKNAADARGVCGVLDMIDFGLLKEGGWKYKEISAKSGDAAFQYVKAAVQRTLAGEYRAIATGPISKEAIHLAGHRYSGHTEILAHFSDTGSYAMLLSCAELNVIHVTTHVSMEEACRRITAERVYRVIELAQLAMRLFGVRSPRIAVAGFNAHCSENGLFGSQEANAITPAIEKARSNGWKVDGPVPADTVFVKAAAGGYDVVVAMYHDQGHIPVKLLGFKMDAATGVFSSVSGINCTIGLPFIRTSVDHGTAFDRAGDNRANEESMVQAINAAVTMSENLERM